MENSKIDAARNLLKKAVSVGRGLIAWRLAVRQKFGTTVFGVPVIIVFLVTLMAPHLVLIAVLVTLIAGYRLSFERR